MSCKTCRFFHEDRSNEISECRRRAPAVLRSPEDADLLVSFWPDVEPDDWCGEYQPTDDHVEDMSTKLDKLTSGGKLTEDQSERFIDYTVGFIKEAEARLIEALAQNAHDAWAGWMKWMLPKLFDENMLPRGINYKRDEPGTTIFRWCDTAQDWLDRWKRQMGTQYPWLSQEEKESDREEARKILAVLRKHAVVTPGARLVWTSEAVSLLDRCAARIAHGDGCECPECFDLAKDLQAELAGIAKGAYHGEDMIGGPEKENGDA